MFVAIVPPTKVLPTILKFIACPILFPLIYKGAIEVPKLSHSEFLSWSASSNSIEGCQNDAIIRPIKRFRPSKRNDYTRATGRY